MWRHICSTCELCSFVSNVRQLLFFFFFFQPPPISLHAGFIPFVITFYLLLTFTLNEWLLNRSKNHGSLKTFLREVKIPVLYCYFSGFDNQGLWSWKVRWAQNRETNGEQLRNNRSNEAVKCFTKAHSVKWLIIDEDTKFVGCQKTFRLKKILYYFNFFSFFK